MKPIIKTDPDVGAAVREVQSEDEEPYTEHELEDLVNLPTDSEPDNLRDLTRRTMMTLTQNNDNQKGQEQGRGNPPQSK